MIKILENVEGWHIPQFVCDACHQPITGCGSALVIYATPDSADGPAGVWHCHKDEDCQLPVRQVAGHCRWSGPWDELADFVVMLAIRSGLRPDEFADRYEYLRQRGMDSELMTCDDHESGH